MKPLTATIIIAVYNDWLLLEYILQALKAQWQNDFDVAIADDGSNADFVNQVKEAQKKGYPFSISHYWHEDNGFGKTIVLNQAVAASKHPYLIFIDGDCLPQKGFVQDHLRLAQKGQCLTGRRIDLPHQAVKQLDMTHPEKLFSRNVWRLIFMSLTNRARNIEKGLRIVWSKLNLLNHKDRGIMGCNFSIDRQDLLAINGFDERLLMCATMVHFDASYDKRAAWAKAPPDPNNPQYFKKVAAEGQSWTPYGMIKSEPTDRRK